MDIDVDLNEVWPASEGLVAMQFETREEFERGRALLWDLAGEPTECFSLVDRRSLVIVVPQSTGPVFAESHLRYTERPVVDGPERLSPEEAEQRRGWMREMNARMLKGVSLEQ